MDMRKMESAKSKIESEYSKNDIWNMWLNLKYVD